jgi:hypothetical protein
VVGLSAPIVTMVGTYLLQRRQQRHDSSLKEMELGHERRLAELSELRTVLDEALAGARQVHATGMDHSREHKGLARPTPELTAVRRQAALNGGRLIIRLGREDEITEAYRAVTDAIRDMYAFFETAPKPPDVDRSAESREAFNEAAGEVVKAVKTFSDRCTDRVGVTT